MTSHTRLFSVLALAGIFGLAPACNKDMPDPNNGEDEPTLDPEPMPEPKELKGGLIISSVPPVAVTVDGKKYKKTPVTVEGLEAGEHEVTFLFEGDDQTTLTVEIGEGEYRKVHQAISPDSSDAIMG